MNRDRKLIFLTVLYFAILGCFLLGCSEGTDSSPVSALMGEITAEELQGSTNKITGLVLNSSTNEGIANILVKIKKEDTTVKSELTKIDGSFTISGFDNGTYTIELKTPVGFTQEPAPHNCIVKIEKGIPTPEKNFIYLKSDSSATASESIKVTVKGTVKRSDNSSSSNTLIKVFKDSNCTIPLTDSDDIEVNTYVLGDGSFMFFNIPAGKNYFLQAVKENETLATYPIGISTTGVISPNPISIPIIVEEKPITADLTIKVKSAYTGAPLELATIKINGDNQGTTDKDGKLVVSDFPTGVCNFEVSKEGFETLTHTKNYTASGSYDVSFSMIEDTKDGYGSITGRFVKESDGTGIAGEYVRLYRLIERTQNNNIGNKTETWYDVDRNYILTTKTSSDSGATQGSFKLTHIEPGYYQIYITADPNDIPSIEERSQVYNEFIWTQLVTGPASIITQPLKVVSDQTTYWTNYEQEYKQGN